MNNQEIQIERMRSPQIRQRIEDGLTTVIFACGAIEQHGPHLPLFMDAEHGTCLVLEIARRLGLTLVAPTLRVGCSEHHMAFSGTISLRRETFDAIVTDYVTSLARHRFQRILIVPTHGGNFVPLRELLPALRAVAPEVDIEAHTDLMGLIELWRKEAEDELGLGSRVGGHADIAETSILLRLHPELVREDLEEPGFQADLSEEVLARIIRDGLDSVTPNGILGDARGATAGLGKRLVESLAQEICKSFESLDDFRRKGMPR